jgi:hypothetical protein
VALYGLRRSLTYDADAQLDFEFDLGGSRCFFGVVLGMCGSGPISRFHYRRNQLGRSGPFPEALRKQAGLNAWAATLAAVAAGSQAVVILLRIATL